jgi:hypothetical protein
VKSGRRSVTEAFPKLRKQRIRSQVVSGKDEHVVGLDSQVLHRHADLNLGENGSAIEIDGPRRRRVIVTVR